MIPSIMTKEIARSRKVKTCILAPTWLLESDCSTFHPGVDEGVPNFWPMSPTVDFNFCRDHSLLDSILSLLLENSCCY